MDFKQREGSPLVPVSPTLRLSPWLLCLKWTGRHCGLGGGFLCTGTKDGLKRGNEGERLVSTAFVPQGFVNSARLNNSGMLH